MSRGVGVLVVWTCGCGGRGAEIVWGVGSSWECGIGVGRGDLLLRRRSSRCIVGVGFTRSYWHLLDCVNGAWAWFRWVGETSCITGLAAHGSGGGLSWRFVGCCLCVALCGRFFAWLGEKNC